MSKTVLMVIIFIYCGYCNSQTNLPLLNEPGENTKYHAYRFEITMPSYNLKELDTVLSKEKTSYGSNAALEAGAYQSLTLPAKFTYNMTHPETFAQICSITFGTADEQNQLFAYLPAPFGEYVWSDRQMKFFKNNRDTVIQMMKTCILAKNHIGINFKHVIINVNATELIPAIVDVYRVDRRDHDLLTVLMLLMIQNKFEEFISSGVYKKLYDDKDASYKSEILFNYNDENNILKYALNFSNGLSK